MTQFTVEIKIDVADDIHKKYPNYQFNFETKREFVEFLVNNMLSISEIPSEDDSDMLSEYGYSIKDFIIK